jgi:hypothetical protein
LADEIQLQFDVDGPPQYVMEQWRLQPPQALRDGGYELADDSVDSLTYESRYLDWPIKVLVVCTLGFALLFKGFMTSIFRVTARFDEQGANTRVLLIGTAHPETRAALGELAAASGGITGPPTPSAASTLLPGSPPSWPQTPPR